MLFTFGLEVDAEKVLLGEPWSYDWHLVILQRFDGGKPISELEFKFCTFWVQIHDLPFKFMNLEMALQIGETIGPVIKPQDLSEMKGGCFIRVRTTINVTQPLCRCRRIVFDEDSVGWITFQYEGLPNMCYWCGLQTHGAKECEMWLKSKGTLSVDNQ